MKYNIKTLSKDGNDKTSVMIVSDQINLYTEHASHRMCDDGIIRKCITRNEFTLTFEEFNNLCGIVNNTLNVKEVA